MATSSSSGARGTISIFRDQQNFIINTGSGFDFPHINAIDIDTDGHILISSRSTSECTKINADTDSLSGEWRRAWRPDVCE